MTRVAGPIQQWDDDKGYGFVLSKDGKTRAFVHINAFDSRGRRPHDGDVVTFEIGRDGHGRISAKHVLFEGETPRPPRHDRPPRRRSRAARIPRLTIAFGFLALLIAAVALHKLPLAVVIVYGVMSFISWAQYGLDKHAARLGHWRTAEARLHAVDFLCGWPGGLVAQRQFHHKTVKTTFQSTFWFTVVANLAAVGWLWWSDRLEPLIGTLRGMLPALPL